MDGEVVAPLPLHHAAPALRGVAKLRVEPDTPGCRLAYARRKAAIETWTQAYRRLCSLTPFPSSSPPGVAQRSA